MSKFYIPERGDIVWLNFDPQTGHEQAGKRPAFILTEKKFNGRVFTALVCPITNTIKKGYPFQVELNPAQKTSGAIICDQLKVLDWQARNAAFIEKADKITTENVLTIARLLLS